MRLSRFSNSVVLLVLLFCNAQLLIGQTFSVQENYTKTEVQIPMRDGVKLHTTIYLPKNANATQYPIMLNRTPYSSQPYGVGLARRIGPSKYLEQDGFIFVKQDVRGRWMSAGQFDNMRPHVAGNASIDESSDTYDTIDWLTKNLPNNGKVGMWGISYPGFYTAAALPEHHPALVAASPQAPIADFFFDDFHHHGAYLLSYFLATSTFGYQHRGPTNQLWYRSIRPSGKSAWDYYLEMVPLADAGGNFGPDNFFWQQLVEHPNYDEFWQRRNILPHLKNVRTHVMTVGGWFDAEDLYGPLNIYRELERHNPDISNTLVMGPWSHGDWSRNASQAVVGNVAFGSGVSDFYQREIEAPFFRHFLKGVAQRPQFEAMVYDTGRKQWSAFSKWPPSESESVKYFLGADRRLSTSEPSRTETQHVQFISDPNDPVPYRAKKDIRFVFTPRAYMSDDQRFATQREDVLTFQTDVMDAPITLAGDILANLSVSTSGTSADWIVKVIDVYPDDYGDREKSPTGVNLSGYQQLVRSEVIRGRFRESYSEPKPFVPGKVETIRLPLQDVYHTFRPGHRMMVQIQSSWFPLIDRNPQTYVDNVFKARREHYVSATHRVFTAGQQKSWLEVRQLSSASK